MDCVELVVVLGAVGFPVSVMMPLVGTDWDERCSMLDPIDSVMGFGVEAAPPLPVVCVTTATLQRTWMPSPSRKSPSIDDAETKSSAQELCTSSSIWTSPLKQLLLH